MILLIDHMDSFTRNLEHLLADFDEVCVIDRKKVSQQNIEDSEMIVLSPGPGKPDDYPETKAIYKKSIKRKPILGICLGFQLVLQIEGAKISRQEQVLHGVETDIEITTNTHTYQGIRNPIRVARYHSLQVDPSSLSLLHHSINITAHDPLRKTPLSFEDLQRRLFGLQYHPESFLTNQGKKIIQNIHHACVGKIG